MQIISHRGYWQSPAEKNTAAAFARSFAMGFGTETDVRDCNGQLVIAHDMARSEDMALDDFLEIYGCCNLPLALNIKADGLATALKEALARHPVSNYFVFDAAVPDMRDHLRQGHPVYTRMSEVEPVPAWLNQSAGVWLDAFDGTWYTPSTIESLLAEQRCVCVVSAELHRRDEAAQWAMLRSLAGHANLMLCTDKPEQARSYFS